MSDDNWINKWKLHNNNRWREKVSDDNVQEEHKTEEIYRKNAI